MNATNDRDDEKPADALFAEIAELKRQRDDCMHHLAACRRENHELRAQLEDRP